ADGISAQGKEVVVNSHLFETQHFSPNPSQQLFGRIPRRHISLLQIRSRLIRDWQGWPVQLPVAGQGQLSEQHESRRHHVVRQLLFQVAAQLADVWGGPVLRLRYYVGHQPLLLTGFRPPHHHRLPYLRLPPPPPAPAATAHRAHTPANLRSLSRSHCHHPLPHPPLPTAGRSHGPWSP